MFKKKTTIIKSTNTHYIINLLLFKIKIKKDKNNKIIQIKDGKTKELKLAKKYNGFNIEVKGNNNTLIFELPITNVNNCRIIISGNNNTFKIGKSQHRIANCTFCMHGAGNNRSIEIGRDFSVDNSCLIFLEENDSSIKIGNDCMFSHDLFIRNSDGHVICNMEGKITNEAKTIEIGNHVWICAYSKIFKNVKIEDNCIIGSGSIVTKSFNEQNCILAGAPAKPVKHNIIWHRDNMNNFKNAIAKSQKPTQFTHG